MFIDGLKLMVTGMVMVFVFLALMIYIINIISKLLAPYSSLLEKDKTNEPSEDEKEVETTTFDSTLISAITVAVHKFREKRNKQKML